MADGGLPSSAASDNPPSNSTTIDDLCRVAETYLSVAQVKQIIAAYEFGAQAHTGQTRRSGEAYISHPLSVALILAEMQMDEQTLCAAILHDVIEDTPVTKAEVADLFSEAVAELVDGVTKLGKMHYATREEAQAASFRKMLIAMHRDIRVIIIKLADRLHNLRTIRYMKPASQRRIAKETVEIYSPIAGRLGMNALRINLEELSFQTLYPRRYQILSKYVNRFIEKYGDLFKTLEKSIGQRLENQSLSADLKQVEKHTYSIYCKMRERKRRNDHKAAGSFDQVLKLLHMHIIVNSVDECYRTLGVVHNLYKPVIEELRDYIAIPRLNGYQSLHTTLVVPQGVYLRVHIRTQAMQEIADTGIATHGLYRFNDNNEQLDNCTKLTRQRANEWLSSLLEMQSNTGNSLEFIEQVKMDLFPNEVYVFTPKGSILQLPRGATAIDFAYAVHTDVGNKCIAVKIDGDYANVDTVLHSGESVEVLTADWAKPNPNWLNFAATARARSQIRLYLRNQEQQEAVTLGEQLLNKELHSHGLQFSNLSDAQIAHLLDVFKLSDWSQLLTDIGLGNRMASLVVRQIEIIISEDDALLDPASVNQEPLKIKGTEGLLVTFSRCCRPIPGDKVVGYVTAGRGITVHRKNCKNLLDYQQHPERLIAVEWEEGIDNQFAADIRIQVPNKVGVLATIASALTNMGINIENVNNESCDGISSLLHFCIRVRDRSHLAAVIRHLRRLEVVTSISRP